MLIQLTVKLHRINEKKNCVLIEINVKNDLKMTQKQKTKAKTMNIIIVK